MGAKTFYLSYVIFKNGMPLKLNTITIYLLRALFPIFLRLFSLIRTWPIIIRILFLIFHNFLHLNWIFLWLLFIILRFRYDLLFFILKGRSFLQRRLLICHKLLLKQRPTITFYLRMLFNFIDRQFAFKLIEYFFKENCSISWW